MESYGKAKVIRVWVPGLPHEGIIKRFLMYMAFTFSALMAIPFCRRTQVVWAMSPNYLCMVPAIACRVMTGSKVVHDVVDIWPNAMIATGYSFPTPMVKLTSLIARLSYIFSSVIVTISASMASTLNKLAPQSVPVVTIENCVSRIFFEVPPNDPHTGWNIMYLGTLSPSNDFATVLETARMIGTEGSGELAGWIRRNISEKELGNVTLSIQRIEHEKVPSWLATADALLIPLRSGFGNASFPSKMGEYLASARPVICVADGELGDLVNSNGIGLVVTPGDSKALAEGIETLRANADLCHKLGNNGRGYAREHFSMDSFIGKVDRTLALVTTNHNPAPTNETDSTN